MSNQQLENIHHQVIEDSNKGIYDDEIERIAYFYGLDQDKNKPEILEFITESIFYNYITGVHLDR
jgi:hypothetical protein